MNVGKRLYPEASKRAAPVPNNNLLWLPSHSSAQHHDGWKLGLVGSVVLGLLKPRSASNWTLLALGIGSTTVQVIFWVLPAASTLQGSGCGEERPSKSQLGGVAITALVNETAPPSGSVSSTSAPFGIAVSGPTSTDSLPFSRLTPGGSAVSCDERNCFPVNVGVSKIQVKSQ